MPFLTGAVPKRSRQNDQPLDCPRCMLRLRSIFTERRRPRTGVRSTQATAPNNSSLRATPAAARAALGRCAQGMVVRSKGSIHFSPIPNNYNNLGNPAGIDAIRTQFLHTYVHL